MSPDLAGRVALVTGAGVGIGQAAALALARAGATVGLHYHSSADGARETQQTIRITRWTAAGDRTRSRNVAAHSRGVRVVRTVK